MEKILIVDGSNLLFQMFYGMPSRIINHQGKAIQGTLGFVGALLKMIGMTRPTHVAVVFDGEYVTQRTELDGNYKGNRPDYSAVPEEDTPFSQLPDIFRALDCLGIVYRETETCEADDWIAACARQYGADREVVIASQDSDFFQLITGRVQVLRYRGRNSVLCDGAYIQQKLGIRPEQYAAYKSLTGDTADNIRGVPKIGPKTAAALMEQFSDLDSLLLGADRIRKPSVRESVRHNRDRIHKNYALICLKGDEEVPFSLDEMKYRPSDLTTMQVLQNIGLRE